MTHRLTPREKPLEQVAYEGWAQGLPGCEWSNQTETQKRAWSKAASATLTALASGSGDHAELAEESGDDCNTCDGAGEVEARIGFGTDYVPCPECVSRENRVEKKALLAEIAALRAERDQIQPLYNRAVDRSRHWEIASINADNRATEAERKLAEAVGVIREISETVQITRVRHLARTFLSKEAERG